MTTLALIDATTLLGAELREALARRTVDLEVRLLTTEEQQVGTLTEVAGAAALVQLYAPEALEGVDLALLCRASGVDDLPLGLSAILLASDAHTGDAVPIVSGVNQEEVEGGRLLASPCPTVVLLAHLLHPLADLGLREAVATVLLPASRAEQEGLDELFEQTRSVLTFQGSVPHRVFGRQLAFNVLPGPRDQGPLGEQVQRVLRRPLQVTVRTLQGGFFHSAAANVLLRFAEDPGKKAILAALDTHPQLERVTRPENLGPIDAAARDRVLVGEIAPEPGSRGTYWAWAVMDNLTRGGAANALEIAELLVPLGKRRGTGRPA